MTCIKFVNGLSSLTELRFSGTPHKFKKNKLIMFMERSYLHFSVILESKVITNKMFFLFFTNANKSKRMLYSSFIKIINKKVIYWFARRLYTNLFLRGRVTSSKLLEFSDCQEISGGVTGS